MRPCAGEHEQDGIAAAAMDRYADGDDAAFATVYDALAPQLRRVLRRLSPSHADDLLQQTFVQMHLARGSFIRGEPVKPWAFAIARRLVIDRLRREKREAEAVIDLPRALAPAMADGPDELLFAQETANHVTAILARIPATQREAFELTRAGGLSPRETASLLGTTVAAVKLRAGRALQALRRGTRRQP
jgi:RNA polymerase sigma-70 factor (ECF subfamily)